jgi:hypothetical protein
MIFLKIGIGDYWHSVKRQMQEFVEVLDDIMSRTST